MRNGRTKTAVRASSAKAVAKPANSRETDAYLRHLGERVRTLRNQRGMTRKALAEHADVSERYLAQLEAGLGNGSIVLLRRIARAIGLPVRASSPRSILSCWRSFSSGCHHSRWPKHANCCSSISLIRRTTRGGGE